MTAIDIGFKGQTSSRRPKITSRVTIWGVVVTEASYPKKVYSLAELSLRILGLLIALGGGAMPFVSLSISAKVGLALAFALVGLLIYRYAKNGLRTELRIDTRIGGIQAGKSNSDGDFAKQRVFPRATIESFFIQRSKTGAAKLCLRLKENLQPIALFQGTEDDLVPAFEGIIEALFVKKGSGKRVKTRANDQFIHATLT